MRQGHKDHPPGYVEEASKKVGTSKLAYPYQLSFWKVVHILESHSLLFTTLGPLNSSLWSLMHAQTYLS